MTHQQHRPLADVHLVMKNPPKRLILTTNGQPANHVVREMIAVTVRLVANNLLMNQQNQLCMSVPTVSR